jgi:pimeloyl-ACP methyl ester carboxylesterase
MARFVLVHGAFFGAWEWEPLIGPLEAKGHTVETLDLPGAGEDQTPAAEVSMDLYADKICSVLDERPEKAVLVGHSMGGMPITHAGARSGERLAAMVYVTAFLPQDGQNLVGLTELPEGEGDMVQANVVPDGDPPVTMTMPDEASRKAFYNCCTEEQTDWAIARQRPQPFSAFIEPVSIPDGAFDAIPRHYVRTLQDNSVRPALQERMLETAGIESVVELDADHAPQLSKTDELADALDGFARA